MVGFSHDTGHFVWEPEKECFLCDLRGKESTLDNGLSAG